MQYYSQVIKESRKKLGMNQKELAERMETSQQAISRWEQGLAEPNLENLKRLSQALSVPVGHFIVKEDSLKEEEFVALYRSLNDSDKKTIIEYMLLLKKQENERSRFE